jgi:hypothetical protein
VLGKNKLKRSFCLINIPRQRNVGRLESVIYRRFVSLQELNNDIIAFDFQFVKDLPPGIFFADTGNVHLEPLQIISGVSVEIRLGYHNDAGFSVHNVRTVLWVYSPSENIVDRLLKHVIFNYGLKRNRPKKKYDDGEREPVTVDVRQNYARHRHFPASNRSIEISRRSRDADGIDLNDSSLFGCPKAKVRGAEIPRYEKPADLPVQAPTPSATNLSLQARLGRTASPKD